HLITSLATPLSSKLDEWRRTLIQLEKDRARQTKRARADLKRAVSEANRWKKKAAKCGSTVDLGPGIGHGILPSTNSSTGTRANMVAAQMANALREVQLKTEQVEAAEQSAVKGFMLEERGRFCFFLSCLLPILECQQSMLNELSTVDELVQSLTKAVKNPEQLMEDAESVLFRAGRGELSRSSNVKSWYDSDNSSGLIAAATAALFANHDHTRAGSSDTDSGRLTMDANPLERKPDDQLDNCSLSSSTQSQLNADGVGTYHDSNLPGHGNHNSNYRYLSVGDGTSLSLGGVSSHSSSESSGGNPGYGSTRIGLGVHVIPGLTEPPNAFGGSVPFRPFDSTMGYIKSGLGPTYSAGDNPLATSCLLPTTTPHQVDMDESQFRTLCRPGHCRTSSATVLSTGIIMSQQSAQPDPKPHSISTGSPLLTKSEANLIHLPNLSSRPIVDQNWLRDCDNNDEEDEDDDDEEEHTSSAEDGNADEGDEVGDVMSKTQRNQLDPNPVQTPDEEVGKSSSKDSGVDSSTVLYPNQALPPPVYTNLNQLAHAAQRKFSIPQIPSSVTVNGSSHIPAPSSPYRTVVNDRLTPGRHSTENTTLPCSPSVSRFQPNVYDSSAIQSVPHNLMTLASAPTLWSTGPTARRVTTNSPGSSSTGIDPFSVELDELDKLGGATVHLSLVKSFNPVSRAHGSFASLPRLRSPVHHRSSLLTFPKTSTPPPSSLSSPYLSGLSPRSFNCMSLNLAAHLNSGQPSFDLSLCASSSPETLSNSSKFDIQECHLKTISLNTTSLLRKNSHVLPGQANASSVFSFQSAPEHTEPSSPLPVRPLTVSVHGSTVELACRTSPISPTFNAHSRGPPISPKPARLRELLAGELLGTRRRTTQDRPPPPPAPIRRSSMLRSSCSSLSDLESRIPADLRRATLQTSPIFSSCFSGSSNASSLTMASSTTSESQRSANGNRLTSVNHAGRLGYSGDAQLSSEDANRLPVSTSAGPVPTIGQTMSYHPATRPSSVVQTGATAFPSSAPTTVSWYANAGLSQTAGPSVSSEAASLMSELSSQLQQLAIRTVSDSVPTRPVGLDSQPSHADDEFDLPPPPPDSMFNTDTVLSDQSMAEHHTALLSALKQSVVERASRITLQEDSATSRPS
ncbi:hypothetical protein EG68_07329, partial [Paragonimus skrjabini miyazakii]